MYNSEDHGPQRNILLYRSSTLITSLNSRLGGSFVLIEQFFTIILVNWNANGIKSKKSTLTEFLSRHEIDIACITETHLNITDSFKITGYKTYRNDRKHTHSSGVVAILIINNLKYYHLHFKLHGNKSFHKQTRVTHRISIQYTEQENPQNEPFKHFQ